MLIHLIVAVHIKLYGMKRRGSITSRRTPIIQQRQVALNEFL